MSRFHIANEDALAEFAHALSLYLRAGDVVLLDGALGAGKTTFVSHLAKSLGSADHVSSPTFSIAHRYDAPTPLIHMDLYRLDHPSAIDQLDIPYYLDDKAVIKCIEWGTRLQDWAPESAVSLFFDFSDAITSRVINMDVKGSLKSRFETFQFSHP